MCPAGLCVFAWGEWRQTEVCLGVGLRSRRSGCVFRREHGVGVSCVCDSGCFVCGVCYCACGV